VLELQGLTRRYGDLVALDDLSFTVAEDQMFGFVGPNGAGRPPPCASSSASSNPTPARSDGADNP
jgi:ABC-2 type transport system ATP-binding protein